MSFIKAKPMKQHGDCSGKYFIVLLKSKVAECFSIEAMKTLQRVFHKGKVYYNLPHLDLVINKLTYMYMRHCRLNTIYLFKRVVSPNFVYYKGAPIHRQSFQNGSKVEMERDLTSFLNDSYTFSAEDTTHDDIPEEKIVELIEQAEQRHGELPDVLPSGRPEGDDVSPGWDNLGVEAEAGGGSDDEGALVEGPGSDQDEPGSDQDEPGSVRDSGSEQGDEPGNEPESGSPAEEIDEEALGRILDKLNAEEASVEDVNEEVLGNILKKLNVEEERPQGSSSPGEEVDVNAIENLLSKLDSLQQVKKKVRGQMTSDEEDTIKVRAPTGYTPFSLDVDVKISDDQENESVSGREEESQRALEIKFRKCKRRVVEEPLGTVDSAYLYDSEREFDYSDDQNFH